ncbi:MAG: hypothetical protein HQ521_11350 [Bacteroidetes bacterium]|nr:hypothetical protein [Bacteroidota bacterium]
MISNKLIAQNPDQIATKDIKIKYVEDLNDGNPIPNSQIYFAYLDINSSTWKTKMVKTDAKGFAKFEVPLRESGDSYAFIYAATNEQEFNEKLDNAKEGKIYLWKIPANDDIKYLELWLDKNMSQSNKVGSMQICM